MRQLRATMAMQKVAALLVTHLPDVRYLCGFTGSNAALAITAKAALMVTDGRYTAQAAEEVMSAEVRIAKGPALAEACRWLAAARVKHAYYDGEQTTVAALGSMQEAVKGDAKNAKQFFQPLPSPLVAAQRMVKDAGEIERMAAAAAWACGCSSTSLDSRADSDQGHQGFMRPGITENAVAAELEYRARVWGAEAMSFATIVASGPRSAMPHGTASEAKLPRRGFVTLDFGVILNGYCSDMTRTVHLGARERTGARCVRRGAGGAGERGGSGCRGREGGRRGRGGAQCVAGGEAG